MQDLYNESLVRELIEKTKGCAISWTHLGGTQFQATSIDTTVTPNVTWDFFVTKTQIGNASAKYTLDAKKDSVAYISIEDGPLPKTGRPSLTQELYEIVELIVLELDTKLKETISFVQSMADCRSGG